MRGDRRRLVVLSTSTLIVYACMSLEVWLILRAVGLPISLGGAMAVETFTRVASFGSVFIPASIGALEASSLAAATAVGINAAGAPLALARRLRGLFWAGVGLAIYPRRAGSGARVANAGRAERGTESVKADAESGRSHDPLLLYVVGDGM